MNSVKLYSNGSAVITKGYKLSGEPLKVSIPVKKSDLDDVVSSISVFGQVTLPVPPSYTPTNANLSNLSISGENTLKDLATKLRGTECEIQHADGKTYKGRLYGVQTYQQETNGSVFDRFRVLVGTEQGVRQFEENAIQAIKFTDAFVQSEIDKALAQSYGQIKPDSRVVDLTLVPNDGATEAAIAYATPVAAWKIRYQLRLLKGAVSLEGQAVVDNDTDDDWNEVALSVITGEPISFGTDIADIRRPARSKVNVVSDTTNGAVQAAETMNAPAAPRRMAKTMSAKAAGYSSAMGFESCNDDDGSLQQFASGDANLEAYGGSQIASPMAFPCLDVASLQGASVRESGDFSVYTSPTPVTILSKRSAIVNLFTQTLDGANNVLLYKSESNPRRPYRAVKFNNTTENSLGKGVCEVYVDGDRQGKCILESTKKGEEAFLVYALETGVKVFKETGNVESRRISLKIKEGVVYSEQLSTLVTTYRVENAKGEDFDFDIEHNRTWTGSKLVVDGENATTKDTPTGQRISTKLAANDSLTVTVTETLVQGQQYGISADWLQRNILDYKHPLARNKGIQKVIELQDKVDDLNNSIAEAEEELTTHEGEQERLLKLIPGVHAEQANKYKNDIATAEDSVRKIRKETLPNLRKGLRAAVEAVEEALASLKANWSDGEAGQNGKADEQEVAKV